MARSLIAAAHRRDNRCAGTAAPGAKNLALGDNDLGDHRAAAGLRHDALGGAARCAFNGGMVRTRQRTWSNFCAGHRRAGDHFALDHSTGSFDRHQSSSRHGAATGAANYAMLLAATLALVVTVVLVNRIFWRRLYRIAEERFRME